MVIDGKITNQSVQKQFFNIPTIRYQLAKRQLTFIGKVIRNLEDQISTQLLTAWCNNKRKPGALLQKNNKNPLRIWSRIAQLSHPHKIILQGIAQKIEYFEKLLTVLSTQNLLRVPIAVEAWKIL